MARLTTADLSILLIEPSPTQLKLIRRHLQAEKVNHIDCVTSAAEALTKIRQYTPDVIISAMYLPDMTADQFIVALNGQQPDLSIPFILISSETNSHALEPIRQSGVMAILPKPFEHNDLQRAMVATLDVIDPEEISLENYDVSELQILLIDDSLTSRQHISRLLKNMGIGKVDTAANGREAIDYLTLSRYDLIITDLNMPEMDGQQLVHYIRQQMEDAVTPVLMTTTENDPAQLLKAEQAGVTAFLEKPFQPQSLRDMLHRLLS